MKKIAIAIAILLAFSAFAMAGDIVVTGDATTTFGYNLDTEVYGLLSELSANVSLIVGEADVDSAGSGDWYGVIELTGASIAWDSTAEKDMGYIQAEWDDDLELYVIPVDGGTSLPITVPELFVVTTPDVAAKITDGNLYAKLQSEADFAADYVVGIEEFDDDPADVDYGASDNAGSWTFGGTFAPATVAVEFATAGSYEDAAQVDGINLGATVGLDLAPLTVDVAFAGGFGWAVDQDMAFAVQVGADVAPLTVTAAFDYLMGAGVDATMEIGAAVSADLAPLTVSLDVYYGTDQTDIEDDVDIAATVGYAADAITVDVTVSAYDVSTDLVWDAALDLTYAVSSGVAFAAGFSMDSLDVMGAYANVALTEVVDNVTFTLAWENGNDLSTIGADADEELGRVIFATNIAY